MSSRTPTVDLARATARKLSPAAAFHGERATITTGEDDLTSIPFPLAAANHRRRQRGLR